MDFPDRNGAAGRRRGTAPRARLRFLAWLPAFVLVAAQAVVVVVAPPDWRLVVTSAVTGVMLVTIVVITMRIVRNRPAAALHEAPRMAYLASPPAPQDLDAPSERIALAYELARRRVPASWIAARCALPHAFVDLIVAEVADSPGPRRRD